MQQNQRINQLSSQLCSQADSPGQLSGVENDLAQFLCHDNQDLRERIFNFFKDPIFKPQDKLSYLARKELTYERLRLYAQQRFFSTRDYKEDPRKFMAGIESSIYVDFDLSIKAGVHYSLCGGTICKLGTQKQIDKYVPLLDNLTLPACFAMTELDHGSNVQGIETLATYDSSTKEIVINTPHLGASKFWIGGAAIHAKISSVFCQLIVDGEHQGIHVVLVRLRDDQGRLMPGVDIRDCGHKMGLNGVDNGQIWFNNVRVPKDDMLSNLGHIDQNGKYQSKIPNKNARFGVAMGGLSNGRIVIAQSGIDAAKIGLIIALRYSIQRPQFGDKKIIDYRTHQNRLYPGIATMYVYHKLNDVCKQLTSKKNASPQDLKQLHVISCGLKAAATWEKTDILQKCRECCGGQGFLSANRICTYINDTNVDTTFEGDNTVLMQQVAKAILDTYKCESVQKPCKLEFGRGIQAINKMGDQIASLLQYRQDKVFLQMKKEMSQFQGHQKDSFDSSVDLAVELGYAHIEYIGFKYFLEESQKAPQNTQQTLKIVAVLFGLSKIQKALYLYVGDVYDSNVVELLRDSLVGIYELLSQKNANLALQLVNGFGVPEHLLMAPIAFDWRSVSFSN